MHFTDEEIRNIYFALGSLKICCFVEDPSVRETCTALALDSIKNIVDDAIARATIENIEKLNREIVFQSTISNCINEKTKK